MNKRQRRIHLWAWAVIAGVIFALLAAALLNRSRVAERSGAAEQFLMAVNATRADSVFGLGAAADISTPFAGSGG